MRAISPLSVSASLLGTPLSSLPLPLEKFKEVEEELTSFLIVCLSLELTHTQEHTPQTPHPPLCLFFFSFPESTL